MISTKRATLLGCNMSDTPRMDKASGFPTCDWEKSAELIYAAGQQLERELAAALKANAVLYRHADSMLKGIEAVVRVMGQVTDTDLDVLAKDRAEIEAARLPQTQLSP